MMKRFLILILTIVAFSISCTEQPQKEDSSKIAIAGNTKVQEKEPSDLEQQFNNILNEFVALHDQYEGLKYIASFDESNDILSLMLFSDFNTPEIVEGSGEVRGMIEKEGYQLIIIDEKNSKGYGVYNPNNLKAINQESVNDDSYTAPYIYKYKIEKDTFILVNK